MGIILGAYLTKNGQAVDLFNRNAEQVAALNEKGATVIGCVQMVVPVKAYLPSEMEGEYDVIFLLTKQTEHRQTAEFLKKHLTQTGVVVTLQNGIPEVLLSEVLGEECVLGARQRVYRRCEGEQNQNRTHSGQRRSKTSR